MGKLTMLRLAGRAMAQLAIQRLLPTQLILHLPAMAASIVAGLETLIRLVDTIWRTELPLVLCRYRLCLLCLRRVHASS